MMDYQTRVWQWVRRYLGADIACDRTERSFRFLDKTRKKQAMKRGVVSSGAEAALPGEWK